MLADLRQLARSVDCTVTDIDSRFRMIVSTLVGVLVLAGCSGGNASPEAWCEAWSSPLPEVGSLLSAEEAEARVRAEIERNAEMLEVAPDEIRDATQTWVDFDGEWLAYVDNNEVEHWFDDVPRVYWSEESGLEEQDYRDATAEILAYAEANGCTLGPGR